MEGNKQTENQKPLKLSYEQLKAYADQIREQAKRAIQENQVLKQALSSRDIEYAFRCLDHADLFSKEFIKAVVKRIEELMNPEKHENAEEEDREEEGI